MVWQHTSGKGGSGQRFVSLPESYKIITAFEGPEGSFYMDFIAYGKRSAPMEKVCAYIREKLAPTGKVCTYRKNLRLATFDTELQMQCWHLVVKLVPRSEIGAYVRSWHLAFLKKLPSGQCVCGLHM
jgi:hypothetical protein